MRLVLGIFFACLLAVAAVDASADDYTVNIDGTTYNVSVSGGLVYSNVTVYNVKSAAYGAVGDGVTDDTSAIQSAVDAAEAVGGGVVYVPQGMYLTTSPITVQSNGVIIEGSGPGSAITNSSSNVIVFGTSSTTVSYCGLSRISLVSGSGGGHVIVVDKGLAMSRISDVNITQNNDDKSLLYCVRAATTGGLYSNKFDGGHWTHTLTATVPGVNIVGAAGSSGNICSDNIFENLRVQYSGDYFFHIECNVASVWNYNNTIRDIECEIIYGGIVRAKSVMGLTVERVYSYDAPSETQKTLFYFSASTSGPQNRGIRIRGCGRAGTTTFASGAYDIHLDGTNDSFDTIIENFYATNSAQINLGSNERCIIIGGYNATAPTITGAAADRATIIGSESGIASPSVTVLGMTVSGGSGSPEAVVSAPVGSLYMRTDGGASTSLYVKESGTGNTGWVAK